MRKERALRILRQSQTRSISMSQAGQDLWVYGEVFNEKEGGYFVDVGAHDGVRFSNTFLLEYRYNWDGICIEANRNTFKQLIQNRRTHCLNVCIDSIERVVKFAEASMGGGIIAVDCDNKEIGAGTAIDISTQQLVTILRNLSAPKTIDYLTIDIEGAEDRALLKFPFNEFKFNCVTIERPSLILRNLFASKGYLLVREIPGLDCFYIHKDFLDTYFENVISFYEKKFIFDRWS
ncbi:FkbM family methyltransferase [Pseudomonadota bacterium]